MPNNLPMVRTSTTRGTLVMTHSPPPRMVEAKIGNVAFFAPLIWISPRSGIPPMMTVRSIVSALRSSSLHNHHTFKPRRVVDQPVESVPGYLVDNPAHHTSLAGTNFHDQCTAGRQISTSLLQQPFVQLRPLRPCHQRTSRFEQPHFRLKHRPIGLRNIGRIRDDDVNAPLQLLPRQWPQQVAFQPCDALAYLMARGVLSGDIERGVR